MNTLQKTSRRIKNKKKKQASDKEKKPFYKKWWFIAIIIVLILGAFGSGGNSKKHEEPQESPVAEAESEAVEDKEAETITSETPETAESMVEETEAVSEFEVTIDVAGHKDGNGIVFDIDTNLPNETVLMLTLSKVQTQRPIKNSLKSMIMKSLSQQKWHWTTSSPDMICHFRLRDGL